MKSKLLTGPACVFGLALIVALTSHAWSDPKEADKPNKNYRIRGLGNASCQNFLDERRGVAKGAVTGFGSWLDGYLTAYNENDPNSHIIDTKDRDVLLWWLGRYCTLRPAGKFIDAVKAMINELAPASDPHRLLPQEG